MSKKTIATAHAPNAIGTYSQAVIAGGFVYVSGQIGLDPLSMRLVDGGIEAQAHCVFRNLRAIAEAAGSSLAQAVRVTIYLLDLDQFGRVNEIMAEYFPQPYPSRATVEVSRLPREAELEVDAILLADSA